ncbi:MAG: hypothetical protein ABI706_14930 [Ilumatobacteraceae bacterium]
MGIDDDTLEAARAGLRTSTLKDTVHEALGRVASTRDHRVSSALDTSGAGGAADR